MKTECALCDEQVVVDKRLVKKGGVYFEQYDLDCPECEFTRTLEKRLDRA